jgi:hypothetical protein
VAALERALAAGGSPNARDSASRSALHLAAAAPGEAGAACVRALAAAGGRVRAACARDGSTALHAAAAAAAAPAARALLELGAAAAAADNLGRTPLHVLGSTAPDPGCGPAGGASCSGGGAGGSGGGGGGGPRAAGATPPPALTRCDALDAIADALTAAGAPLAALDRSGHTAMARACDADDAGAAAALWRAGARLPPLASGALVGGVMDLIAAEADDATARLAPRVAAGARAVRELETVLPGLQRLLLDGCAAARRAERAHGHGHRGAGGGAPAGAPAAGAAAGGGAAA